MPQPELAGQIEPCCGSARRRNAAQPGWNAKRDLERLQENRRRRPARGGDSLARRRRRAGLRRRAAHELRTVDSPAAKLIVRLHSSGRGAELVRAKHLRLWDDLVALRFLNPSLGTLSPVADQPGWSQLTAVDAAAVRNALPGHVADAAAARHGGPRRFPQRPGAAAAGRARDRRPQIITRHGLEEWKATVLTSELHRHLGTYSIVGAKMGLRARERFNVALDELRVESHAGLKPPLSCVNDGLQVATGASLGRGTITVLTNTPLSLRSGVQLRRTAFATAAEAANSPSASRRTWRNWRNAMAERRPPISRTCAACRCNTG